MERFWILAGVLLSSAAGFARFVLAIRQVDSTAQRTNEFNQKFVSYIQSDGRDAESYTWLIQRSPWMQGVMGTFGIAHHFRPPYSDEVHRNYPIVLNMLPAIRRSVNELHTRDSRQFYEYANLVQEALLRFVGTLDDERAHLTQQIRNPLSWFREGIQLVVLSPFLLLRQLGLEQLPSLTALSRSPLVKALSAVVALCSLIASLVTILVGWEQSVAIVRSMLE